MPTTTVYIPYSDSIEEKQPDEDKIIAQIVSTYDELQQMVFEKHGHAHRGAHAKSHGVLRGTLQVLEGLPEELAQGLFRQARTYPVIVRFSTAPGNILPDRVSAFRGVAIKVIGVEGEKVLPEERDALTQDLTFINHPTFSTGDVHAFLQQQRLMLKIAGIPDEAQETLTTIARNANAAAHAVGGELPLDIVGTQKPETHPLGETYFSAAPLRWGDYFGKVSLVPTSYSLHALIGQHVDTHGKPSALREAVVEFFRVHEATYELRVQLCTNLETMPVEDASVEWPESESPYRAIARLTIPAQEANSPARRVYADDSLTFNSWHSLPEHRPLGSIQRSRRAAYEASTQYRHTTNSRVRVEPCDIGELPD